MSIQITQHAGLEAAKASGHVNVAGASRVEVMELSKASLDEQAKHQATIRQFEIKRHARSVTVPTAIADVKLALRALGLPVTLFAEGPYDRRERLREAVAAAEMEIETRASAGQTASSSGDRLPAGFSSSASNAAAAAASAAKKEVLYSAASEALLVAREALALHSFRCAKARLAARQSVLDSPRLLAAEDSRAAALHAHSRKLQLDSTAAAEQRPLVSIRYSPHGELLATGSLGCNVSLWGAASLQAVASLTRDGHRERLMSLCWHPTAFLREGAALLASTSADSRCLLWDCREHVAGKGAGAGQVPVMAPLRSLQCGAGAGAVTDCEFHPSGRYLAASSSDYSWRLFDVETAAELQLQDGHTKDCTALAFQPDGALLMSCDALGLVLLWDLRSGQQIHAFQGHMEKVTACTFNCNGFMAATASLDNTVRVWDLRRQQCSYLLPAHASAITDAKYSASGEQLLTASFDGTVRVWAARDHRLLRELSGHSGKVMSADFSPGEDTVASAGFDRTVKLWAVQ